MYSLAVYYITMHLPRCISSYNTSLIEYLYNNFTIYNGSVTLNNIHCTVLNDHPATLMEYLIQMHRGRSRCHPEFLGQRVL